MKDLGEYLNWALRECGMDEEYIEYEREAFLEEWFTYVQEQ